MAAETIKPEQINKPRSNRKLDRKKTIKLIQQGVSACQIAKLQDVAPSTVTRYLATIGMDKQALDEYKINRADIKALIGQKAEELQLQVMHSYNVNAMPDATKNGLLMATNAIAGTRYQEERLERGMSTVNLASIHADIASLQREDKPVDK